MDPASPTWGSRIVAAFEGGEVSAAEMWDVLLAHGDEPHAEELVDRLLTRLRRGLVVPHRPALVADDDILVVDDDRELLVG